MSTTTTPVKSARYDRETGDFCAKVNGEIIGWCPTLLQAEALCNEFVYNLLARDNASPADLAPDEAEAVLESQQLAEVAAAEAAANAYNTSARAAMMDANDRVIAALRAEVEAEAAQRELVELERQAGVAETRVVPAAEVPAEEDRGVQWQAQGYVVTAEAQAACIAYALLTEQEDRVLSMIHAEQPLRNGSDFPVMWDLQKRGYICYRYAEADGQVWRENLQPGQNPDERILTPRGLELLAICTPSVRTLSAGTVITMVANADGWGFHAETLATATSAAGITNTDGATWVYWCGRIVPTEAPPEPTTNTPADTDGDELADNDTCPFCGLTLVSCADCGIGVVCQTEACFLGEVTPIPMSCVYCACTTGGAGTRPALNNEPTTTNPQTDTAAADLAALLEAETVLHDYAAFVAAPDSEAEAACEWAAAMVRARIDCAGLFTTFGGLADLAAHVAAPGWHERELNSRRLRQYAAWTRVDAGRADERLPFQERQHAA